MTTTMSPPVSEPGVPSAPADQIDEPEHDELSLVVVKLARTLDEAVDAGFHSSGKTTFSQRDVDVLFYARTYAAARADEESVPA